MLPVVGASSSSASIAAGSKVSASRARLGFTPSIQMVSELMWKNGASPSSGNALTTAPPVPSSRPRSSEMVIFGLLPRREVALDLLGEVMHVDHRALDAGFRQPVEHVIDQRLAADLDQWLRHFVGERAHAGAEARRQHHGVARS